MTAKVGLRGRGNGTEKVNDRSDVKASHSQPNQNSTGQNWAFARLADLERIKVFGAPFENAPLGRKFLPGTLNRELTLHLPQILLLGMRRWRTASSKDILPRMRS